MNNKITDLMEMALADALEKAKIKFVHESETGNKNNGLDFYLPEQNIFIETKQYHSVRVAEQMSREDEVIVIQGKRALEYFITLLRNQAA